MGIGFHFDDMEKSMFGISEEQQYYNEQPIGGAFHENYEEYKARIEQEKAQDKPIGAIIHDNN